MTNNTPKSYLYAINDEPGKQFVTSRSISEWSREIPLGYKILVSCDFDTCHSRLFIGENARALYGDYSKGVILLARFLKALVENKTGYDNGEDCLSENELDDLFAGMSGFFGLDRGSKYFLLEFFDLYADELAFDEWEPVTEEIIEDIKFTHDAVNSYLRDGVLNIKILKQLFEQRDSYWGLERLSENLTYNI